MGGLLPNRGGNTRISSSRAEPSETWTVCRLGLIVLFPIRPLMGLRVQAGVRRDAGDCHLEGLYPQSIVDEVPQAMTLPFSALHRSEGDRDFKLSTRWRSPRARGSAQLGRFVQGVLHAASYGVSQGGREGKDHSAQRGGPAQTRMMGVHTAQGLYTKSRWIAGRTRSLALRAWGISCAFPGYPSGRDLFAC
jgi:hypothetical protein